MLFPLSSHRFAFLTVSIGQVVFAVRTIRIGTYPAAIKKGLKSSQILLSYSLVEFTEQFQVGASLFA